MGKVGFGSLGMGITDRKTIELGLGLFKFGKTIGWEMGSGQNLGWENGIYTPPSGPSTKILIGKHSTGYFRFLHNGQTNNYVNFVRSTKLKL